MPDITNLKRNREKKFDRQGGLENLRQEFNSANSIAQLKAVMKKILKAQGVDL